MSWMTLAALLALLQPVPMSRPISFPLVPPLRQPSRSRPPSRSTRHLELAVGPTAFYSVDMLRRAGPNMAGGGVDATVYFDRWPLVGLWLGAEVGAASLHLTDPNLSGMAMSYGCVAAGPHLYRGSARFLIGGRYCHFWSIQTPDLESTLQSVQSSEAIEGMMALEYTAAHFLALEIQFALGADSMARQEGMHSSREWLPVATIAAALLFVHDVASF
jgi:hypothetical protein